VTVEDSHISRCPFRTTCKPYFVLTFAHNPARGESLCRYWEDDQEQRRVRYECCRKATIEKVMTCDPDPVKPSGVCGYPEYIFTSGSESQSRGVGSEIIEDKQGDSKSRLASRILKKKEEAAVFIHPFLLAISKHCGSSIEASWS
jgi:hypothetical protein